MLRAQSITLRKCEQIPSNPLASQIRVQCHQSRRAEHGPAYLLLQVACGDDPGRAGRRGRDVRAGDKELRAGGNRTPSKAQLSAIARGLDIEPEALVTYDINSAREALGVLFQLEDAFGITPNEDGTLSIDPKADSAQKMVQAIKA